MVVDATRNEVLERAPRLLRVAGADVEDVALAGPRFVVAKHGRRAGEGAEEHGLRLHRDGRKADHGRRSHVADDRQHRVRTAVQRPVGTCLAGHRGEVVVCSAASPCSPRRRSGRWRSPRPLRRYSRRGVELQRSPFMPPGVLRFERQVTPASLRAQVLAGPEAAPTCPSAAAPPAGRRSRSAAGAGRQVHTSPSPHSASCVHDLGKKSVEQDQHAEERTSARAVRMRAMFVGKGSRGLSRPDRTARGSH